MFPPRLPFQVMYKGTHCVNTNFLDKWQVVSQMPINITAVCGAGVEVRGAQRPSLRKMRSCIPRLLEGSPFGKHPRHMCCIVLSLLGDGIARNPLRADLLCGKAVSSQWRQAGLSVACICLLPCLTRGAHAGRHACAPSTRPPHYAMVTRPDSLRLTH